jgi:transposase
MAPCNFLPLVDAIAAILAQAYQLARVRLASAGSPVLRMLSQCDHAKSEVELLRRELAVLRASRQSVPSRRRPDYDAEQRLAILQLKRHRGWSIPKTARRFIVHPNTIRSWIKAIEGRGNASLFTDAIVWNRLDDALRWTMHELRRLCPHPEFGTRSIARQLLRAGLAASRSTVQRVLREVKPKRPCRRPRNAMAAPLGVMPHHLLVPLHHNHVWHIDLTSLRLLWFRFTTAAILDGFSRRLLSLRVYRKTPRQLHLARLVIQTCRCFTSPCNAPLEQRHRLFEFQRASRKPKACGAR